MLTNTGIETIADKITEKDLQSRVKKFLIKLIDVFSVEFKTYIVDRLNEEIGEHNFGRVLQK